VGKHFAEGGAVKLRGDKKKIVRVRLQAIVGFKSEMEDRRRTPEKKGRQYKNVQGQATPEFEREKKKG